MDSLANFNTRNLAAQNIYDSFNTFIFSTDIKIYLAT